MTSDSSGLSAYDVHADWARLRRESLGPLFARLSVELTPSTLDAKWRRAYEAISRESERFTRFTLDTEKCVVLFTCRANDTAAEIQSLLQRLDLLLELANLRATIITASQQSDTA